MIQGSASLEELKELERNINFGNIKKEKVEEESVYK
jgi:hypothetical protein